jgi:hypothetical protein
MDEVCSTYESEGKYTQNLVANVAGKEKELLNMARDLKIILNGLRRFQV